MTFSIKNTIGVITMTRTFRTAAGRKVRVNVGEAEARKIRAYRLTVLVVPVFWMVACFRAAGLI